MIEPKRWLADEAAPAEVQELLRGLARPEQLDGTHKAALAARLGNLYAPLTPPVSTPFWAKAAAVGGSVALAGAVLVAALLPPSAAPAPSPAEPPPPAAAAAAPAALATPEPVAAPASTQTAEPSAPPTAVRPTRPDTLAREEALLEQARRAASRDPRAALPLLQRHRAEFPRGELTPERLYLTADVLRRMGDAKAARQQAEALIARYPRSVYARRLKARLEN